MTLVSLTDCCHRLAVDPKTLRRWMSRGQLETLPHPSDARIKCVTRDMVQQLAATHHRMLLDRPGTHFQQETPAPIMPTVGRAPEKAGATSDLIQLISSDLLTQLASLQERLAALQD